MAEEAKNSTFLEKNGFDYRLSEFKKTTQISHWLLQRLMESAVSSIIVLPCIRIHCQRMNIFLLMVKYSTWQTWPICTSNDKTGILRLTRKSGVKTVVNIGIQDCQKDINELMDFIENADIIILNALEFATLVKKSPEHLDVSKDVATLAHLRPKQILIVTDGKNGSYVYKWRNFLSGGKSWNHNC